MIIEENSIVYPLPTKELLEHREGYWHVTLPESYKEFIAKYNGGIPIPRIFYTEKYKYSVDRFLCIIKNASKYEMAEYDIDIITTGLGDALHFCEEADYPELIPILKLEFGNYVCLNYRYSRENPTIVLYYTYDSWELEANCEELFPDFDTFLASFDAE